MAFEQKGNDFALGNWTQNPRFKSQNEGFRDTGNSSAWKPRLPSRPFSFSRSKQGDPFDLEGAAPYNKKTKMEEAKLAPEEEQEEKFFCRCCTKKRCAICGCVTVVILVILIPIFFLRIPDFEADLETLDIADVDIFPPGFTATFELEFVNNNFLELTVEDLDSQLVFEDLVIEVDLVEPAVLPRRSVTRHAAQIVAVLDDFDSTGSAFSLLFNCIFSGTGTVDFTLKTVATGKYLGVTSEIPRDDEPFPFDCAALF